MPVPGEKGIRRAEEQRDKEQAHFVIGYTVITSYSIHYTKLYEVEGGVLRSTGTKAGVLTLFRIVAALSAGMLLHGLHLLVRA